MKILMGAVVGGLAVFIAFLLLSKPMPPLPSLLQSVTAAGGWVGACPPVNKLDAQIKRMPLALSSELNQRLASQFPQGSEASKLESALIGQGFGLFPPCEAERSIHVAGFKQYGGGLLHFPLAARAKTQLN